MKIVFTYEHYFPPFDEGVKNLAHMIHQQLARSHDVQVMRYFGSTPNTINSLLIVPRLINKIIWFRPEKIIFIPQAALTFSSIIKIFTLQLLFPGKVTVVGVQKRGLSPWQTRVVKQLKLSSVFVLSSAMAEHLKQLGITASILNVGIDLDRYCPVNDVDALRNRYKIPTTKPVVLHVGHIKESRNIRWLLEVQKVLPDVQVVIVGSTTTEQDIDLSTQLEGAGIIVLREYLSEIQELYQLADVYCFTVMKDDGAMEIPLSVLEGMATNLPVITTRFGRLPELFSEDEYYRYVSSADDIIRILKSGFDNDCENRAKMHQYTWQSTSENLLAI